MDEGTPDVPIIGVEGEDGDEMSNLFDDIPTRGRSEIMPRADYPRDGATRFRNDVIAEGQVTGSWLIRAREGCGDTSDPEY